MKNNSSATTATTTTATTAVENNTFPELVKIETTMSYNEFVAIRVSLDNDLNRLNDILSKAKTLKQNVEFWEETIAKVKNGLSKLESFTFVRN